MQNAVKARFAPGATATVPTRRAHASTFKSGYEVSKGAGPALPLRQVMLAQSQALTPFFTGLIGTYIFTKKAKTIENLKTRPEERYETLGTMVLGKNVL
ncbi:MAG: hypothetical protein A2Y14_03835 [Verrucomicrobia bacterium GWF2_51_19]|nr:MAG: hypothetical protein A2Y14_03835 [Verrucomicrobia bacterium GWF2_51_19]HCJ12563.1 hypothetical protein [Opitutae bacterium]